jgi:hypothetical protein
MYIFQCISTSISCYFFSSFLHRQPLASARLRRENIAEQRIALAIINMAESWKTELKLVVTPPAIGIDLTLPGGLAVAMEA